MGRHRQAELEGTANIEVLREHLLAYDENDVIFDYETGKYGQVIRR